MAGRTKELRAKRKKAIDDARAIVTKAREENRELNAEETESYDRALDSADEIRQTYEREERLEAAERDLDRPDHDADRPDPNDADLDGDRRDRDRDRDRETRMIRFGGRAEAETRGMVAALQSRGLLPTGIDIHAGRPAMEPGPRGSEEYRAAFRKVLVGALLTQEERTVLSRENRALQIDEDPQGGYMVASEQMAAGLIAEVDDAVAVRQRSQVYTLRQSKSLGLLKRHAKMSTFAWGSELAAPTADTALQVGKRSLTPHDCTGEILVSRNLLRESAGSAESLVNSEMARDAAEVLETGYMTGSGAGDEPLGIFTASADGISTARDFAANNLVTGPTLKGLRGAKYGMKQGWWAGSEWIFHQDIVKLIADIEDSTGRPIWQESVRVGEPDRLLNLPLAFSDKAPSTIAANAYVGALANLGKGYAVVSGLDLEIQRLVELHARTNQVGFIGRLKEDAMPVQELAFSRVKLAAS